MEPEEFGVPKHRHGMKVFQETIPPPIRGSFLVRRFEETRFSSPFHRHPEIELTYIVRSSGTRIVGDRIGHFTAGDLCLIGANLPHVFRNNKNLKGKAISEVLHFPRELANGSIDEVPELGAFALLLDQASRGVCFGPATARRVGPRITEAREAGGTRRWRLFFEIAELLCGSTDRTILCGAGYSGGLPAEKDDRIQKACQHILEHYQDPLPHDEMARRVNVTKSHFSRIFKRATKKTYQEFLSEVRLGHACRLLAETDWPVVDIAFDSGFNNLSNFNRRFRQTYGTSPRDYRKQLLAACRA